MASNRTSLTVQVITDATKAAAGLNETAAKFESFGKKAAGAVAGFFVADKIVGGVKAVVSAASQMEQAMGGTDKVFGSSANAIHAWAADTSDSIRLPAAAVESYATLIKTQLAATGAPMDELVTQTKALIQVGADLSAVTGKDLASSVEAVKSALAGEYDPIQSLGVAMSGASVQAKALALAHGDTALAASDAIVMQARYLEIVEKSAFAQGAAAEEANSFQGRMDSLKEVLSKLAVAIGGPLLDAFGGLISRATELAPSLAPIAMGIADIVSAVAGLPTPVFLGVAALGALALIGPKIAGMASSFAGMVGSIGAQATVLQRKAAETGSSMTRMAAVTRAAGGAMAGAFGGAAGLAMTAAIIAGGAALFYWSREAANAKKAADDAKGAIEALKGVLGTGKERETNLSSLKTSMSELITPTRDVNALFDEYGIKLDTVIDGMSGFPTAGKGVLDSLQAQLEAKKALQQDNIQNGAFDNHLQDQIIDMQRIIDIYGPLVGAQESATAGAKAEADAIGGVGEAAAGTAPQLDAAAQKAKAFADQMEAAKQKLAGQYVTTFMQGIEDEAKRGSLAVDYLTEKLRIARGEATVQIPVVAWVRLTQQMKDYSDETDQLIRDNEGIIMSWDAVAINQIQGLQGFFDDMSQGVVQYGEVAGSAFEEALNKPGATVEGAISATRAVMDEARAGILEVLGGKFPNATAEQIDALATKIGFVDEQVISDKDFRALFEAEEAQKDIDKLAAAQVPDIPVGVDMNPASEGVQQWKPSDHLPAGLAPTIPVGADPTEANKAPGAFGALISGMTPAKMPLGADGQPAKTEAEGVKAGIASTPATIPVQADPAPANATIADQITGTKREAKVMVGADTTIYAGAISALIRDTANRTAIVKIDADPAQADAKARSFMTARRQASDVIMDANTSQADEAARAFMTARRQASDIIVSANTGPAQAAISAVQNGFYRATVTVFANADPFWAAFNALPTSKTVTMTTQQQTVILPPVNGPVLFSAATAPSLARTASVGDRGAPMMATASGSQSGTNYTINISGALWPDQAARAVEDVLRRRDRRRGVVTVR